MQSKARLACRMGSGTQLDSERDFDDGTEGLKLARILANHTIVKVAEMLGVHGDDKGVGKFVCWREVAATLTGIVVDIEHRVA